MATLQLHSGTSASIPNDLSSRVDLLIALHLHSWQALSLAIQNAWGGSAQVSTDKRDWFAGAISELLTSNQLQDVGDLEEVLLQVMVDEFEVVVDDDSAEEVARKIWTGATKLSSGDTNELQTLYEEWEAKRMKGGKETLNIVRGEDKDGEETDWDEDEEEWNGFDDDIDMDEAPTLIDESNTKQKQKIEPEIDEDGFTKVVTKKKR